MKLMAIIPARGGSKGIKNKNIVALAGKPLIQYSIDAALGAKSIKNVFVSSDDQKILEISEKLGTQVITRPAELSTDTARTADAIVHTIQHALKMDPTFTHFILLQPTSPFRSQEDIENAVAAFNEKQPKMLISTTEVPRDYQKMFVLNEQGFLEGAISPNHPFMPRQKLPRVFMPNGAIYICAIEEFLKRNDFPQEAIVPYLMSEEASLDIDDPADLLEAEEYLKKKI